MKSPLTFCLSVCYLVFDDRDLVRRSASAFLAHHLELCDDKLSIYDKSASALIKWRTRIDKLITFIEHSFSALYEEGEESEEEFRIILCEVRSIFNKSKYICSFDILQHYIEFS